MRDFQFSVPEPIDIDPQVAALTAAKVDEDIAVFSSLLDAGAPERDVHAFLEGHSYFFNGILRMYGASPLYSKVRLGSDYEVDFAFFDSGSYGPDWHLVEIEAPSHKLFTSRGDPSGALNHAIQQVRNWHSWFHANLAYCSKLMPHIEYPMGYVFIGRRSELDSDTRSKLKRLAYDYRSLVHIHTLDRFISAAMSVRDGLLPGGRTGSWPVRMNAYSHADLAARQPASAWEFLMNPNVKAERDWYTEDRAARRDTLQDYDWG
jgi:hypothetical protein|nr:Shedu anti-phage system protein SduA domain-containing protein [uncultured Steroidobacter sp.]